MSKIYWQISADIEHGEGDLTPATRKAIEQMIDEDPILAADILKDAKYDIECLYEKAVKNIFPSLKAEASKE